MSVTLTTNARNGACNGVVDLADVSGPGHLKIYTTGLGTLLADITLSNPAFGASATGVATLLGVPKEDTSADNSGTAAEFKIEDGAAAEVLRGSVGTSGQDINLNTTTITVLDTVSITDFTVTMPAT